MVDLIEPFGVGDVFISGVGQVERMEDGAVRITCYVRQRFAGEDANVVVARLVMAEAVIPEAILAVAQEIGLSIRSGEWHDVRRVN